MRSLIPNPTGRQVIAGLIGILMCIALALSLLPNAEASSPAADRSAPSATAEPAQPGSGTVEAQAAIKDKIKFGEATLRAGKQAGKIARKAMSKSGKTLNYAKATKVGGRTKWRRQFAAGFYWQGGRITHISDAELAEVKKLLPPSPAQIANRAPNCRGENKTVVVRHEDEHRIVDTYYDSCETIDLVTAQDEASWLCVASERARLVSSIW
jgi:hypothetical protein